MQLPHLRRDSLSHLPPDLPPGDLGRWLAARRTHSVDLLSRQRLHLTQEEPTRGGTPSSGPCAGGTCEEEDRECPTLFRPSWPPKFWRTSFNLACRPDTSGCDPGRRITPPLSLPPTRTLTFSAGTSVPVPLPARDLAPGLVLGTRTQPLCARQLRHQTGRSEAEPLYDQGWSQRGHCASLRMRLARPQGSRRCSDW